MSVRIDQPGYNEMNVGVNNSNQVSVVAETDDPPDSTQQVFAAVYSDPSGIPSEVDGSQTQGSADGSISNLWNFDTLGTAAPGDSPGGLNYVAAWEQVRGATVAMTVSPFYAVGSGFGVGASGGKVRGPGPNPAIPFAWLLDATQADVVTSFKLRFVLQFTGQAGLLLWENKRPNSDGTTGPIVQLYLNFPTDTTWTLALGSPAKNFTRSIAQFDCHKDNLLFGKGASGRKAALRISPV